MTRAVAELILLARCAAMLVAFPQIGPLGAIQVWVRVFGTANPPQPVLEARGAGRLQVLSPLQPIRDGVTAETGAPLNHRARRVHTDGA